MYEKRKAFRVVAWFKDFDGTVEEWKLAFYELWRYQMTWGYAYHIEVLESGRGGDVAVVMVVNPSYAKHLAEAMEDFGYREVTVKKEDFLFVESVGEDPDDEAKLLDVVLD